MRDHLDEFLRVYPNRFAARFGPLRPEVEKGFRAFLRCDPQGCGSVGGATEGKEPTGAPEDGFATFRCPGCGASFIVPFSCKHWLCPSCSAKRTLDWAAWLVTEVLYDQPHYHIVATLPTVVRDYFIRDRKLLGWLASALAQMLNRHLTEGCRHPRAIPGIITVPQTFGEKLNANPHFHVLATTMNVDPETGGYFDPQGRGSVGGATEGKEPTETRFPSFWEIRQHWRNLVLAFLEGAKKITRKQLIELRRQFPKGFHVNVSVPGSAPERQYGTDREPRAAILSSVGKYLVRTPLTEARLAGYAGGKVTLRYRGYEFGESGLLHKKVDPDYEELDALDPALRDRLRHSEAFVAAGFSPRFYQDTTAG